MLKIKLRDLLLKVIDSIEMDIASNANKNPKDLKIAVDAVYKLVITALRLEKDGGGLFSNDIDENDQSIIADFIQKYNSSKKC